MSPLERRVVAAIRERRLWRRDERVVVAVSGGADSMALLDLLIRTQRRHGAALEVATVDHGTRPGQAEEVAFVCAVAAMAGLSCHAFPLALGPGASEATARAARYAALRSLGATIATAHHRDDLVETVLINLLRGTGIRGLRGIRWSHEGVVRPLLGVSRAELRGHLLEHALSWRDDPTNLDPRHLRNRVRHEVVPLLEDLRPGAARSIAASAARVAEDDAWLAAAAADPARQEPAVLRRRWIASVPGLRHAHVDDRLSQRRLGVLLPGGASFDPAPPSVERGAEPGHESSGAVRLPGPPLAAAPDGVQEHVDDASSRAAGRTRVSERNSDG